MQQSIRGVKRSRRQPDSRKLVWAGRLEMLAKRCAVKGDSEKSVRRDQQRYRGSCAMQQCRVVAWTGATRGKSARMTLFNGRCLVRKAGNLCPPPPPPPPPLLPLRRPQHQLSTPTMDIQHVPVTVCDDTGPTRRRANRLGT